MDHRCNVFSQDCAQVSEVEIRYGEFSDPTMRFFQDTDFHVLAVIERLLQPQVFVGFYVRRY